MRTQRTWEARGFDEEGNETCHAQCFARNAFDATAFFTDHFRDEDAWDGTNNFEDWTQRGTTECTN